MKRFLLLGLLLWLPLAGVVGRQPSPVRLSDPASWSLVLLPDLQIYTRFDQNQPIADLMVRWIKANRDSLNIRLVLSTGDLVDQNNLSVPDGTHGDQTSARQWEFVSALFGQLDGVLPYIHCIGNHDIGRLGSENRESRYPEYFPAGRNPLTESLVTALFPDYRGERNRMNACYEFVPPFGPKWLICSLEFNPRPAVVKEAQAFLQQSRFADYRLVFLTHSYIDSKGKRFLSEPYPLRDVTCGQQLWERLIRPLPNASLVLCGHVVDELSHRGHVGFSSDRNAAGKNVRQMLFNAQGEGGGWSGNGGDGWLRLLEFLPDGKTVRVVTYSPLFGASPSTVGQAFRTESYDSFTFELE